MKKNQIAVPANPVVVGKIGSMYGILGWMRFFSSTEEEKSIFNYQPWFIKNSDKWKMIKLEKWRRYNNNLIVKIKGIECRESAMLLTNCKVVIDESQLVNLNDDEYYWKDLLRCQVVTVDGYHLGEVINLIKTGANDVLVVKAHLKDAFGIKERLIPFLNRKVIKSVNLVTNTIKVDWEPNF